MRVVRHPTPRPIAVASCPEQELSAQRSLGHSRRQPSSLACLPPDLHGIDEVIAKSATPFDMVSRSQFTRSAVALRLGLGAAQPRLPWSARESVALPMCPQPLIRVWPDPAILPRYYQQAARYGHPRMASAAAVPRLLIRPSRSLCVDDPLTMTQRASQGPPSPVSLVRAVFFCSSPGQLRDFEIAVESRDLDSGEGLRCLPTCCATHRE